MTEPQALGVSKKWQTGWKKMRQLQQHRIDVIGKDLKRDLDYYTAEGRSWELRNEPKPAAGAGFAWFSYLWSTLGNYAHVQMARAEIAGKDGMAWAPAAAHAFDSAYLTQIVLLHLCNDLKSRNAPNKGRSMNLNEVPYAAMGIVLGDPRGLRLGRALCSAYRGQCYSHADETSYPIFHLVLRLIADFHGDAPVIPNGTHSSHSSCEMLLDVWKEPNVGVLVPALVQVCDFHTHRLQDTGSEFAEFANLNFTYIPFEILLVLKLRELRGLVNPAFAHPLMDSALGKLPQGPRAEADPIVKNVEARLIRDGLDEEDIFRRYGV